MKALVLTFLLLSLTALGVLTLPDLGLHDVRAAIPLAAAAVAAANVEPIFVSVADAAEILATSRSEIYQRIARGELDAVKDGARTKITYDSVKRVAAALPKANVKLYVRQAARAR
jgi:excisionase family DNA binding protein